MAEQRLWKAALGRSDEAEQCGALKPLKTEIVSLGSWASQFECRRLQSRLPRHLQPAGPKPNPFRPWDPNLEVEGVGRGHMLILNKYPVQRGHMLLITRQWAAQTGWLNEEDWQAVQSVDQDTTGLWFFNSGPLAGASQPHRHLQLLPRNKLTAICPRATWFETRLSQQSDAQQGAAQVGALEQSCGVRARDSNEQDLYRLYTDLVIELGLGDPAKEPVPRHPYNLLLSPTWMAVILRNREKARGFSINGLGFAGYLLATDESDVAWLERYGPEELLKAVVA